MTFKAFTDEEWRAIRAVRDDWPDDVDWSKVRRRIEGQGFAYRKMHESRTAFGLPPEMRKSLERLLRQMRKLQVEVKSLPDHVLQRAPDFSFKPQEQWPPAPDFSFKPQEQWLQDWLSIYEDLDVAPFSGRSDRYRDFLCEALLELWVEQLGGELTYSRRLDGTPYGPLIDFLAITLKAILGKAPGPSGIAKIIDQYR